MPLHISKAPFALCILLAGCAQPHAPAPQLPSEAHAYACRPSDAPSGAEQHVTVQPDSQHGSLLLRLGAQTPWRNLAPLAGSSGQVFGDAGYAWRGTPAGGVLTDIANVQTYNCTLETADTGPVK